jgi:hypothetical protein
VENFIAHGRGLYNLDCLLKFLAAWDERPNFLAPIAYQWCSALFEVAGRVDGSAGRWSTRLFSPIRALLRLAPFKTVGCDYDGFRSGDASRSSYGDSPVSKDGIGCLRRILKIGFRKVHHGGPVLRLDHVAQRDRTFKAIFSSDEDETIADAVCIWIGRRSGIPLGSLARYLAGRVQRAKPLSPRLRRVAIRVVECIGQSELEASGLETIRLLNRLQADVDELSNKCSWEQVLISAVCSPAVESLSSHCLCSLGKLLELPVPRALSL